MSEDTTTRELLLQLNQKLTEFIASSSADRATLNANVESIKTSVSILNHNSTSLDARVANLETTQITNKAIKDHFDVTMASTRNWILFTCGVIGVLLTVLSYFHPF